jgi:hypothetical protein
VREDDIDEVIVAKRINRTFYNELKDRDPLLLIPYVDWAKLRGTIKYLSHRKIFTSTHEQVLEYWNSGEVNEVLRNAENAIDKPDRYFAFKTLLLSSPEVDKTGIYRNYQQASANINVGTQYFTKLISDGEVQTKNWLWDIEPSATFDQTPPIFFNFANALLMTFCVNNRPSFKNLIEGCIKIIGAFYSRKTTVPPLLYIVGMVYGHEAAVTRPEIELVTKAFNLKYFEITDFSSLEIANMMDTVRDDMQKAAAGKYIAEKQGLNVTQQVSANKKWCSLV